jgi:hypothetical protein
MGEIRDTAPGPKERARELDDADDERGIREVFSARNATFSFAFLVAALGFAVIFVAGTLVDMAAADRPERLVELLFGTGAGNGDSLLYLAQIVAAILGIALTVVAIVVQLAANRYTAKIIDLFVRDPVNVPTLALFVASALEAIWVAHIHKPGEFVPRTGITITTILATASLLVLVPYFRHVFTFLEPQNVIKRIRDEMIETIDAIAAAGGGARAIGAAQARVIRSLDHLYDIARNSVGQSDRSLAIAAVFAVRDVLLDAGGKKARLPAGWFEIRPFMRKNTDFLNFPESSLRRFEEERSWLERKTAWELFRLFVAGLNGMRGLCTTIALAARELGEDALGRGAAGEVALWIRAFNTFIRGALNARDVRTAFNLLQQYRLFAERLIALGAIEPAREVVRHLRYYGRTADRMGLGFVLETAAHDTALLAAAALAAKLDDEVVREMLGALLGVDADAEAPLSGATRRGLRRAQVVLAARFLLEGREDLARTIADDMRREPPATLAAVREEILTAEPEFFELTERVASFGYIPPEAKPHVERFFGWLAEAPAPREPARGAA